MEEFLFRLSDENRMMTFELFYQHWLVNWRANLRMR